MKTDRIFVLLLVVLLPMTGCFDDAVGDAEGTDEADGTSDTGDNGGTQVSDAANSQARTWYSSGGVYQTYWDDGQYSGYESNDSDDDDNTYRQISSSSQRCLDWGHTMILLQANLLAKDAMNGVTLILLQIGT